MVENGTSQSGQVGASGLGADPAQAPNPLDAMAIAYESGTRLPAPQVTRPLAECVGEVLAQDVRVVRDVPHYDSSAMDGFAVRGPGPWIVGENAWPVATGSLVPSEATSVVRQEWVQVDAGEASGAGTAGAGRISLAPGAPQRDLEPGRNIRRAGREALSGELVARAGELLTPAQVAFAAVAGHDTLPVCARPRVGLLLTGTEVVASGLPQPGFVRDAFGPQLPAYVRMLGAEVVASERIGDGEAETEAALEKLVGQCDVVVSTGGTGHSRVDEVRRAALRRVTGETGRVLFPELNMRPGHPTFLMEHSGVVHVGLPGNPLAAMVALRLVLAHVLRGALGRGIEQPGAVSLAHDFDPGQGRSGAGSAWRVMPAKPGDTSAGEGGQQSTQPRDTSGANLQRWELCDKRGSNMLRGLAQARGLVVIPPEGAGAGDAVACLPLPV
ncbi:molybdopterin molybdotransferase [Brevibacterium paucivorans]|uniref:Molybdopterin molybdenumtransferase n=1 Tax=Brevibacterium paucivorans TaxID=170994 RepID=A0ABS2SJ30_9MICO|nr:molybdopterin molybdotransferase MoeA [Brevibacterium paucivorans]MBM7816272.1 molybdopterin molybdotransferase [Brevibacterium paucivorans]